MAGLGDLIVKLKLDGKEYKKGLEKSKKDTEGFSSGLLKTVSKVKGGWLAVAGAVAGAVTAMGKLSQLNQELGDKWNRTVSGMKNVWDDFMNSLVNGRWDNLFGNLKEAYKLGKMAYDTKDALTEVGAGRNVFLAMNSERIADLEIKLRSKGNAADRKAAGEELVGIYREAEAALTAALHNDMDATINKYLKRFGYDGNAVNRSAFIQFIKLLGTTRGQKLMDFVSKNDVLKGGAASQAFMRRNGYQAWEMAFAAGYNKNMNDKGLQEVTDAIVTYYNQLSAVTRETKKIQTQMNNLTDDTTEVAVKTVAKAQQRGANVSGLGGAMPELITEASNFITFGFVNQLDGMEDYLKRNQEAYDEWLAHYEEGIRRFQDLASDFAQTVSGTFADSVQYMMDSLFGLESFDMKVLMAKMLEPLADLAMKEGELIMAEGIAMKASQTAFSVPEAGIAAGAALIAVAAAAKAGLSALSSSRGATTTTSTGSSGSSTENTINSELTVYVTGKISGSDIVISGNRTINKWNR